jgi:hypothetical protein
MTRTLTQLSIRLIRFLPFATVVAVLGHEGAHAQQNTITGYNQVVGQWNAGTAARTTPSRVGTGSPVGRDQCNGAGESYFQSDAKPGQNNWYCTAPGSPRSVSSSSCMHQASRRKSTGDEGSERTAPGPDGKSTRNPLRIGVRGGRRH